MRTVKGHHIYTYFLLKRMSRSSRRRRLRLPFSCSVHSVICFYVIMLWWSHCIHNGIMSFCICRYAFEIYSSIGSKSTWNEYDKLQYNTTRYNAMFNLFGVFQTHFIMINVHMNYTTYQLVVIIVARSNYNISALESAFSKCFSFYCLFTQVELWYILL